MAHAPGTPISSQHVEPLLYALAHPVRAWMLTEVVRVGRVSAREVLLEWPALRRGWDLSEIFRRMADHGLLKADGARENHAQYYVPGPRLVDELTLLNAMTHALLTALEVRDETDD